MTTSESKGRFFLQNKSIRITNQFESRIGMLYSLDHVHTSGIGQLMIDDAKANAALLANPLVKTAELVLP